MPEKAVKSLNNRGIVLMIKRSVLLCAGLFIMAMGIAFSIKASLGISPVSTLPYVASVISGMSVGVTTIMINCGFVLMQLIILRRKFKPVLLLQIPLSFFFGSMIDVCGHILVYVQAGDYLQQCMLCMAGIVLLALGVSMEVTAGLVTAAGEGVVLAMCQVLPVKFGNMKVAFDVLLVSASAITALLVLGQIEGVREGTVASAVMVGLIVKQFSKPLKFLKQKYLV